MLFGLLRVVVVGGFGVGFWWVSFVLGGVRA